jgi:hypothetical protein
MNAAPIAAIAVGAARRRVIETFLSTGALSPDRAISFEPSRRLDGRMTDRMLREGVLHQLPDGRMWMEETAMRDLRSRRLRILALVLALLAALWVLVVAITPIAA